MAVSVHVVENALICSQDIDEDGIIQDALVSKGTAPCSIEKCLKKSFWQIKKSLFCFGFCPTSFVPTGNIFSC